MGNGRVRTKTQGQVEGPGNTYHREFLKQDIIRMARGDHDAPLLTARGRATTSLTDLFFLVTGKPAVQHGTGWQLPPD